MGAVADVANALRDALAGVPGVRAYTDVGAMVDPPAAVLGPPRLTWQGPCSDPIDAMFLVYVVVSADARSLERLWDLTLLVAEAIESVSDAVVRSANPGVFNTAGVDLPCYEISIEVGI